MQPRRTWLPKTVNLLSTPKCNLRYHGNLPAGRAGFGRVAPRMADLLHPRRHCTSTQSHYCQSRRLGPWGSQGDSGNGFTEQLSMEKLSKLSLIQQSLETNLRNSDHEFGEQLSMEILS